MKMQTQNTKQTSTGTGTTQKLVLPQIRYHPSIQAAAGGARARTTANTRTSMTQKTRPGAAQPPQTGTSTEEVQENKTVPAGRPHPDGRQKQPQEPVKKPADPGPNPRPAADRAPPSPEQLPLGVLDKRVAEEVEVMTRGQSTNPDWFAWRKNRITASVAHRIARSRFVNGKSRTPPTSYLAAVTGEGSRVQTRAMSWGVNMEAEVVCRYQKLKTAALGRPVLVQDCGLFIDARRPWLAASPDGIVMDGRTGQWLLCLEVKCPYKHRERRVEDACRDDPAFCLEIQDEDGREDGPEDGPRLRASPVYRLKTSHSYFTQIQCQLAVTGLQRADLVVFTLKETVVVPVTFDPELWEETVSKLEVFYRDAVLPHIRQKTQEDGTAARTPEM